MQESATDYYEFGVGCCLLCYESHPGCLCMECKCKKCFWYSPPEEWDGINGHCDKTDELIRIRKEEWIEEQKRLAQIEFEKAKLLEKYNKSIEKPMNNKWYSCQKCKRDFISKEDKKIIIGKEPICPICSGEIKIKEDENGRTNKREV